MVKANSLGDGEPKEATEDGPEHQGPSFEDLMMLVFSGPMCFECLDESEEAEDDAAEEEIRDERPVSD